MVGFLALLFAVSLCFVPWFRITGGSCIFRTSGFVPIWQLHTKVDFGPRTPPEQLTREPFWMSDEPSTGINLPIVVLQWSAIGAVIYALNRVLRRKGTKLGPQL